MQLAEELFTQVARRRYLIVRNDFRWEATLQGDISDGTP
jgi:hypothetical protein